MTHYTYRFGEHTIYQIPAFTDNYIYLICKGTLAWAIDPGEPSAVQSFLAAHKLHLQGILNTHHHWDLSLIHI